MGAFDKAIAAVSPGWAAARAKARMQTAAYRHAQNYYDGADQGRRGASIRRSGADPNVVSRKALASLRAGARDMVRNNPHANRGVGAITSHTVGRGIKIQFRRDGKVASDVNALALAHLGSTQCDADGMHNYYGIQRLAVRAMVESGECLIRRRYRRSSDGLKVPVQFQVLEGDMLDHTKEGPTSSGGYIIQGIEFDKIGRRRGYWMFDRHPNGVLYYGLPNSSFVPAADVIHLYRADRPGQVRGIPWLAPIMLRAQDFADYEEAQLVRQKVAACFTAFVQDNTAGSVPGVPGVPSNDEAEDITGLEPGMVESLPPGRQVVFASPPPITDYQSYANVSLHAIAMGLGISYEMLTGDLRGVSFTSGRMGYIDAHTNIDDWRWITIIPRLCNRIGEWVLEAIAFANGTDTSGITSEHTPPRREMLNPQQEINANTAAMRSGQSSLFKVLQAAGIDPETHMAELKEIKTLLDGLGLVLDMDPSKVSAAGLTQARTEGTTTAGVFENEGTPDNEQDN